MKEQKHGEKSVYSKPRMQTIDLSADEVMSGGCKTDSGAGGVTEAPHPFNGCINNECSGDLGS